MDLGTEMLQLGLPAGLKKCNYLYIFKRFQGHIEVLVEIYSMENKLLKDAISVLPFKGLQICTIHPVTAISPQIFLAPSFKIASIEKFENSYLVRKEDSGGNTSNFVMEMDQLKRMKEGKHKQVPLTYK
jgi:hypothetical protein